MLVRPSSVGRRYVAGESVWIVARFSAAVAVEDSAPPPRLALDVPRSTGDAYAEVFDGTRESQPADLIETIPDYDLPFRAEVHDLLFRYDVQRGDKAASLAHRGRGAMYVVASPAHILNSTLSQNMTNSSTNVTYLGEIPTWARVAEVATDAGSYGAVRRACNGQMVTKADTSLRGPHDLRATLGAGGGVHVDRQWRGGDRFPTKVELVVRGLAHPHAGDLEMRLSHGNASSTVFGPGSAGSRALGRGVAPHNARAEIDGAKLFRTEAYESEERSRASARQRWGDARGADYVFSDIALDASAPNDLAPLAVAAQSSTAHGGVAARAVDGDVDPYYTHGSVTHTAAEAHGDGTPPWWGLRWPVGDVATVGTIKLWNRLELPSNPEVQAVTVEAFGLPPSGSFRLLLDVGAAGLQDGARAVPGIAANLNGTKDVRRTEAISAGAPPSVADEAEGTYSVQRALQDAFPELGAVAVSRHAAEEPQRTGDTYLVTFLDYPGDLPELKIDGSNATGILLSYGVDEVLKGSPGRWYGYAPPGLDETFNDEPDFSGALYPCWVMLFDEASLDEDSEAPRDLAGALGKAAFSVLVQGGADEREATVDVDPARFRGGGPNGRIVALRVQLADDTAGAALSLAEVQVFANRSHTVAGFQGGGTVAARPWTAPYQADASLSPRFSDVPAAGRWTLEIRDHAQLHWYRWPRRILQTTRLRGVAAAESTRAGA